MPLVKLPPPIKEHRTMKPKKIEVVWEDHHERDGQGASLLPHELKPMLWRSVGYLVAENDTMIELARDVSADRDVTDVGASLRLLKSSIISRSDQKRPPCKNI
jgi:hypothetical protein